MQNKYTILRQYYGYISFREGQEPIIDNILAGRDILAVMPTGAGKSIIIDALGLLAGTRGSADLIRYGCDRAEIEAGISVHVPYAQTERRSARPYILVGC